MDPGTALAVVSLGIQVCSGLLTYYGTWKTFNTDVTDTYSSIISLSRTLALLDGSLRNERLDSERGDRVKACLQDCEQTLVELGEKLRKLRKHAKPEGLSRKLRWQAQRALYPFQKETLDSLKENANDVQARLQIAVQVLHLDTSQRIEARVLEIQESAKFSEIFSWLAASDPETNHAAARQRREPGTGEWLLDSDEYQQWKSGLTNHIWASGKAGCGKTVLSSTVIEDMRDFCEGREDVRLGIFYFTFSDTRKQTYEDLLRSLVHQFGWKRPGLEMLQKAYDKNPRRALTLTELEDILQASVKSYQSTFVVLDALDESPEESDARHTMLEGLEGLSATLPNLRIFATSRELTEIGESMKLIGAHEIHIDTSAVDADIRRYVASELRSDRRFARLTDDTKLLIEDVLSKRADGMFRWAYCQLLELKKLKSTRKKYVEDALYALPKTLDETYERMLSAIELRYAAEALTLLRWLAFSERPLRLAEVAEAALIDPAAPDGEQVEPFDGNLDGPLDILAGLISVVPRPKIESDPSCAGSEGEFDESVLDEGQLDEGGLDESVLDEGQLDEGGLDESEFDERELDESDSEEETHSFQVDSRANDEVRLAHFSVKEYLVSERIRRSQVKEYFLQRDECHGFLAQSCLAYLLHYSSHLDQATVTSPDDDSYSLPEYAASCWYKHLYQGRCDDRRLVMLFLHSQKAKSLWLKLWNGDFGDNDVPGPALYYACRLSLKTWVQILIEEGVEVNESGGAYGSALRVAVDQGDREIVELLLNHGADVNPPATKKYGSPLQIAAAYHRIDLVELLLDRGADVNADQGKASRPLAAVAASGSIDLVRLLVDRGALINTSDDNALWRAAWIGKVEVVEFLLDRGADVNLQDFNGETALMAAASEGRFDIVKLLLDRGADVHVQQQPHGGALQAAAAGKNIDIVRLILDHGADVNPSPALPCTSALEVAARNPDEELELVRLLIDRGADMSAKAGYSVRALGQAAEAGYCDMVRFFLDMGADVNAKWDGCETVLAGAVREYSNRGGPIESRREMLEVLLNAGAEVNAQGGTSGSALYAATQELDSEMLDFLISHGAYVNARGPDGTSVLYLMAEDSLFPALWLLLERGADVNLRGGPHRTALRAARHAARDGVEETIQLLFRYGAIDYTDAELDALEEEDRLREAAEKLQIAGETK